MKKILIYLIVTNLFFNNIFALENKIILKINNEPITSIDILNEIERLIFFEPKLAEVTKKELYEIAVQSISKYKIKEIEISKKFEIKNFDNENYVNSILKKQASSLNYNSIDELKEKMILNNLNFSEHKQKIIIDILWNQIIYNLYFSKVKINEEILKEKIKKQDKNSESFFLREIAFVSDSKSSIAEKYDVIKNDINIIGFGAAAIKHSISDTAKTNGDLGWVNATSINPEILNIIKSLKNNEFTKPIRVQSSFVILQLVETRKNDQELDFDNELKALINYETNSQLKNFSNLYFNKINKNIKIDAP